MWRTATVLISITLGLITLGLIMLASTGAIHGDALFHDPYFFIKRQVAALLVGLVAACVTARIDYHFWRAAALPLALVVCLLLVLTLIPGIGVSVKGSRRWLDLGPINLQPSELAKLVSVLVVAWWMTRVQRRAADLKVGLLVPGVLLSVLAGLVLKEPDYGTTMLILCAGAATMFVGGTSPGHLAVAGALGLTAGLAVLVMENAERMRRIIAFMNPEDYALDEAYQLLQSKAAFVAGGWSGVGLGHSLQKQFYLPEAHTDFIFAILGEELGLSASLGVAVLFSGILHLRPAHQLEGARHVRPPARLRPGTFLLCLPGRAEHRRGHRLPAHQGPPAALHQLRRHQPGGGTARHGRGSGQRRPAASARRPRPTISPPSRTVVHRV
jgi:cell division protein FtsW